MTAQLDLFDRPAPRIHPTDTRLPEPAAARIGGQSALILDRLRSGPASNLELEGVSGSHRINSRVADVRRFLQHNEGKTVLSRALDTKAGVYEYEIVPNVSNLHRSETK